VEGDRFAGVSARLPNVDLDLLCRNQTVAGDLSEFREHGLDLLARVNGLDYQGKILRETEHMGRVEDRGPTVSGDTADDGRTRDPRRLQDFDDRFLERMPVVTVALAEVHPEEPTVGMVSMDSMLDPLADREADGDGGNTREGGDDQILGRPARADSTTRFGGKNRLDHPS